MIGEIWDSDGKLQESKYTVWTGHIVTIFSLRNTRGAHKGSESSIENQTNDQTTHCDNAWTSSRPRPSLPSTSSPPLLLWTMEAVVTFNDIFEEADGKLGHPRPSFSKDFYASAPSATQVDGSRLKVIQGGLFGSWTSISIFTFSLFIITATSAYYINSYLVVRKRLRDLAAAEL